MKIGIDIDEVLAEFISPFLSYYNLQYNTHFKREQIHCYDLEEALSADKESVNGAILDFMHSDLVKSLPVIPVSQKSVRKLGSEHDLTIITSRSYSILGKATEDWLEQNFPKVFSKVYFTGHWLDGPKKNKHQLCAELGLDLMIEDNLDYAKKCAQVTQVYLFDCPWNQENHLPEWITRVKNWPEIMHLIAKIS